MARSAPEVLVRALAEAAGKVAVEGQYVHYKRPDRRYAVVTLAILEETEEVAVVYRALYDEGLTFIRPLSNWLETVPLESGKRVPRFTRVQK